MGDTLCGVKSHALRSSSANAAAMLQPRKNTSQKASHSAQRGNSDPLLTAAITLPARTIPMKCPCLHAAMAKHRQIRIVSYSGDDISPQREFGHPTISFQNPIRPVSRARRTSSKPQGVFTTPATVR
ncbi:hypothetical protein [Neorhizobium sp. JUb45]|uniref:hypothetical protein n=1 Tax=unclassified Neorhizobium TaxID=2629175 RepID=UPI001047B43B|nr:hypothetical protein [Neorhizobium sp. JUb45]